MATILRFLSPLILFCIALTACGGDPDCPAGRVRMGDSCVVVDAGVDGATGDACLPAETCNGLDDDCDGTVDEGTGMLSTFYADADGDMHGTASGATVEACAAPPGFVATSDDCDDADETAYPGAVEDCDGVDEDCDGAVDEGLLVAIDDPIPLGEGSADALFITAVAPTRDGWFAAWTATDGTLSYVLLDALGSSVSGSPQRLVPTAMRAQVTPHAAVMTVDGVERVLVAWREESLAYIGSVRPDMGPVDPPIALSVNEVVDHPRVVPLDDDVLVVWERTVAPSSWVEARAYDPSTNAPVGTVAVVRMLGTLAAEVYGLDAFAVGGAEPHAIVAYPDGPSGSRNSVYVERILVDATGAHSTGMRTELPTSEETLLVRAMGPRPAAPDIASIRIAASSTPDQRTRLYPITPGAPGTMIGAADALAEEYDGGVIDTATFGGSDDLLVFRDDGTLVWIQSARPSADETIVATGASVAGSIERRTANTAAIVYAVRATDLDTTTSVFFQPIGCPPPGGDPMER